MKNSTKSFIAVCGWYIIQGAVNGSGYSGNSNLQISFSVLQGIFVLYFCLSGNKSETYIFKKLNLFSPFITTILVPILMITLIVLNQIEFLDRNSFGDIHLWTSLSAYVWFGYCAIFISWKGAILGVYPGLVIEKGLINTGAGLSWFDVRTDDPTGKTFCIPTLDICISRSSVFFRYALAFISLIFLLFKNRIEKWILSLQY